MSNLFYVRKFESKEFWAGKNEFVVAITDAKRYTKSTTAVKVRDRLKERYEEKFEVIKI